MNLPPNIKDWPEEWRASYEERAAVIEDGTSYGRLEAERFADSCVRMEAARTSPVSPGTMPFEAKWPWER